MPKLIQFFGSLNIGGIERSMVNLSHQFQRAGVEVVLVLLRREGPLEALLPEGVTVVSLQEKRNTFFALPKFIRALKIHQPDAVLAAHPNINFVAVWARLFVRKRPRLVISERSSLSMASKSSNRISLQYRALLEKLFYPLADGIVAVSGALADDIARSTGIPRCKITVIYNPVFSENIREFIHEPVPTGSFPPNTPVILGVGRFVEAKDFKTLVHAFAAVRSRQTAKLILLGDGPLRDELSSLVHQLGLDEDVRFPGFVTNPYAYMARASVLVLSSRYEGFPNVLAESLACGTPVVATDCETGPAEILENGRYGKLVPIGDSVAMAGAIQETLASPPDPEILRRRAASFSASSSARQYLSLLFPDHSVHGRFDHDE